MLMDFMHHFIIANLKQMQHPDVLKMTLEKSSFFVHGIFLYNVKRLCYYIDVLRGCGDVFER
jgi:hypothetical protein